MALSQIVSDSIQDGAVSPIDLSSVAQYTGFKNRIINGAMVIDQRNAGASVTQSTSTQYSVDRYSFYGSAASKFTLQQNAGSVTPPAGFSKYLGATSSSAYSILTSDYFVIQQNIEGYNWADMAFGTSSAATVTLSFWVYSSLTGTFGGVLKGFDGSSVFRSYPFTYTISAANTWSYITITIPGDTTASTAWSSTQSKTNGYGLIVVFGLGVGATYSGTAGTWATGNLLSATGATSVVGTSGATFYITGVQLEKGSTATSFDYRPYGTELALCKRFFRRMGGETAADIIVQGYNSASQGASCTISLDTGMRTAPTVTQVGTWAVISAGSTVFYPSSTSIGFQRTVSSTGTGGTYTVDTTTYLTLSAEL